MLLKGGHLKNKMIFDILVTKKEIKIFKKEKLEQKIHMVLVAPLSSALATCLSQKKKYS